MDIFKLFGTIVIDADDAIDAIDNVKDKAKGLGSSFSSTGSTAQSSMQKYFSAASVWMGNVATKLTSWTVDGVKSIASTGMEYNKMMEGYTATFTALLGDGEKAQKMLDDLWTLAADTPMEMTGLAKNAETLLSYGMAVEDIIPTLKMLGDVALGDQSKLDGLSRAYGQIFSYGNLRGQETMQLIENGFPILKLLEETMGMPMDELLKAREEGGISFDDVSKALNYATSENGQFYNAMALYAQTIEGQQAKLNDAKAQTLGKLTAPFGETYKDTVLPGLADVFDRLGVFIDEHKEEFTELAETIGTLVVSGAEALLGVFEYVVTHGEVFGTIGQMLQGSINLLQWLLDHETVLTAALGAIAIAFTGIAIATHPLTTAIAALSAFVLWIAGQDESLEEYLSHMEVDNPIAVQNAGKYKDWTEEQKAAAIDYAYFSNKYGIEYDPTDEIQAMKDAGLSDVEISEYRANVSAALNEGDYYVIIEDFWFDERAEEELQTELDNMGLNVDVGAKFVTDTLDENLHWKGDYRKIGNVITDVTSSYDLAAIGGMQSTLEKMLTKLDTIAANTSGGTSVTLDSGVLVGQLTSGINSRLGSIVQKNRGK